MGGRLLCILDMIIQAWLNNTSRAFLVCDPFAFINIYFLSGASRNATMSSSSFLLSEPP